MLQKVVRKTALILEELKNMIIDIKATMNSDPITFVYDDPHESSPLIPVHFLVRKHLMSLASVILSNEKIFTNWDPLITSFNY